MAARELTGEGHRASSDLNRVPARLEPQVHMDAVLSRGLRVTDDAELVEQFPHQPRDGTRVFEVGAGCGIEVDAELVRMRGVDASAGHTWKPRQPRFTAHATCARSAITSARDVVPLGVLTISVVSHSGALSGTRFW